MTAKRQVSSPTSVGTPPPRRDGLKRRGGSTGGGSAPPPPTPTFLNSAPWDHAYSTSGPEFIALGLSNNGVVSNWPDEIGSADAVQATDANRPLYITDLAEMNGIDVVRSNGLTRHLRTASWGGVSQPNTVAVIGRLRIRKAQGAFVDGLQSTTKSAVAYISNSLVHVDGGDNVGVSAPVNLTGEAPNFYVVEFNGASSKVWIGGRLVWTGSLAADQLEGLTFFDSAEISGGVKTLDGEQSDIGILLSTGTSGGQLEPSELAALTTLAKSTAGCEDLTSGIRRYPDCWSRAAQEADGSVTKTLVVTPTAGDLLVASMVTASADSTHAVSDDLGVPGAWTKRSQHTLGARGVSIWTKTAIGTEATVTMAGGTGVCQGQVDEIAGWSGTYAANQGDDGGGSVTVFPAGANTPNVTTVAANSIIFFVAFTDGVSGQEVSWTNAFHAHEGNTGRMHTAHKVVTTAATHETVFTWTTARRALWCGLSIAAA